MLWVLTVMNRDIAPVFTHALTINTNAVLYESQSTADVSNSVLA